MGKSQVENIYDQNSPQYIQAKFEYFEDTELTQTYESIRALTKDQWTFVEEGNKSFGFNASKFWLRLGFKNDSPNTENFLLEIAYPMLDDVVFYSAEGNGVTRKLEIGDSRPFYPRDVDHPNNVLRFQLSPNQHIQIFASVQSQGSMILPLKIWREDRFYENAAEEQKFHFFYYGGLSIIALVNFFIFLTLREKVYLYYSFSTAGYLLFFLTTRGYIQQLFFPNQPDVSSVLFLVSMPVLALFSLLFAREFLRTYEHSPKTDMALRGMIYFEYFNLLFALFLDYNTASKISALSVIAFFSVLFIAGPVSWHAKQRAGIFYTIAWVPLTIGFIATGGRVTGILPNTFWTEYAMQIGSGLEVLILTLALADRLYREREEKILAQQIIIHKDEERLEAQNKLSEAMMRDSITHLPNANRFEWLVDQEIKESPERKLAVCVAKVSRIQEITRTLGLASVESILRTLASRTNITISKLPGVVSTDNAEGGKDAIYQLTGDTYGILFDQAEFFSNQDQYQSFVKELSIPIAMDSLLIDLEPRLGCAIYPKHGSEAAQIIRNAIVGMESSHHAADQIGFYDTSLDIYSESRLTLMSDLRAALAYDEPALHYQPKMNLRSDQIVGLEALIRWQHDKRGYVPPDEFIPLAEETGVIRELTLWAIERAAKDMIRLNKSGYEGYIAVNISAKDLLNEDLPDQISQILQTYGIEPSKIYLELTETAAMDEPEAGLEALTKLTEKGLKISIDDFGSGYSSLSYLKQLPASEIKLDRSLIEDIDENESSRLIVKASIDISHGLGCSVVAEGVEDKETRIILECLNCDTLQGYWLCKPKSIDEIENWLVAYKPA